MFMLSSLLTFIFIYVHTYKLICLQLIYLQLYHSAKLLKTDPKLLQADAALGENKFLCTESKSSWHQFKMCETVRIFLERQTNVNVIIFGTCQYDLNWLWTNSTSEYNDDPHGVLARCRVDRPFIRTCRHLLHDNSTQETREPRTQPFTKLPNALPTPCSFQPRFAPYWKSQHDLSCWAPLLCVS